MSKLDINAAPVPDEQGDGQCASFEILEAGTGHGALTMYLSRAVSAFNPPMTTLDADGYETWRDRRRAVIHTIDVSAKHSKHARKVVKEFRRGIYLHNVDFHVGSVSDWVTEYVQKSGGRPRLAHAFLDLPSPVDHLDVVSSALLPSGKLMIFAPSITTILECYRTIKMKQLDLYHSSTIEFGNNGATGGREWDLRQVIPRKSKPFTREVLAETGTQSEPEQHVGSRATDASNEPEDIPLEVASEEIAELSSSPEEVVKSESESREDLKWVCRPKVGDRINGGGFLGIFIKRNEHRE